MSSSLKSVKTDILIPYIACNPLYIYIYTLFTPRMHQRGLMHAHQHNFPWQWLGLYVGRRWLLNAGPGYVSHDQYHPPKGRFIDTPGGPVVFIQKAPFGFLAFQWCCYTSIRLWLVSRDLSWPFPPNSDHLYQLLLDVTGTHPTPDTNPSNQTKP